MSGGVDSGSIAILDKRLGSIEAKLDSLIRLEERQESHAADLKRAFVRIEKVEDRVRTLEIRDGAAAVRTNSNAGAITIIVSSVVSIAVGVVTWKVRGG
jgi:hypothetical protein